MTSSNKKKKPGTPFPPDKKYILRAPPPLKCCRRKWKINNEKNIGRKLPKNHQNNDPFSVDCCCSTIYPTFSIKPARLGRDMVQNLRYCCFFSASFPTPFSPSKANCSDWSIDASGINLSFVSVDLKSKSESKKRQTAAQSSTLQKGNFVFHARTADSTSALAAVDCEADATMSTTSSFDRTSQICSQESNSLK